MRVAQELAALSRLQTGHQKTAKTRCQPLLGIARTVLFYQVKASGGQRQSGERLSQIECARGIDTAPSEMFIEARAAVVVAGAFDAIFYLGR